ncbi:MAG: hypothetical protein ABSG53_06470, partial [Thermoguttaceae bacterium]
QKKPDVFWLLSTAVPLARGGGGDLRRLVGLLSFRENSCFSWARWQQRICRCATPRMKQKPALTANGQDWATVRAVDVLVLFPVTFSRAD